MSHFLVSLLILLLFIVFVICVLYLMVRYKHVLLGFCVVFVAIGFLMYTASYLSSGDGFAHTLLAALRGIFSTARMFIIADDYAVLMNTQGLGIQGVTWLTEDIRLQIFFWLSHIAALILVQAALLSLFGRGILDWFRLHFGLHREVYIIKGSDKNALMLGENIATHDRSQDKPDPKQLIVFLFEEDDNAKKVSEKVSHFGGIVKVLNRNADLLYCLKTAGLIIRDGREKGILSEMYVIIASFYQKCQKMIGHEIKYKIILTPDNVSTPDDACLIARSAKKNGVNPNNLDIYVFTSSEWDRKEVEKITQAKEGGERRKYPYTFHIMNEVDLLTRQMIQKHPPFECPRLHFSNGMTKCNFTVMVLGFGTVGQSALLHLVMNGQFVGSRMCAIIIDKNIDKLRDCFLQRYPHLELCCEMEFKNFDVQCNDFFNLLREGRNFDYIIIALNNNKLNKQTALNIQSHHTKCGNMSVIPFIAISEKDGSLHEVKEDDAIFTFGCREEIYKESVVIREDVNRMAKAVHEAYGGEPPWHELDWFYQESNRAVADFIPAMLKLANIKKEDALNSDTLTEDQNFVEILAQTEKLRWNAFHAAMGYSPISIKEMQERFDAFTGERNSSDHLAYARKDSNARSHVCLASWNDMDAISEAYRELARRAGVTKDENRDFKGYDREIITYIPTFLKEEESKN